MTPGRMRRAAVGLVPLCLGGLALLGGGPARGAAVGPKATARESVAVRAGMGADDRVVGELETGEVVTIDMELDGDAGRRCGVIQEGKTTPAGYVPCKSLERRAGADTRGARKWKYVQTRTRARPDPEPREEAAKAAGEKRPYADVKVLAYVTSWCPFCAKARALLGTLGVSVTEYDIEREPARKAEMVAKSGRTGIPFLDIEGIQIAGFDEVEIREAVEKRRAAR